MIGKIKKITAASLLVLTMLSTGCSDAAFGTDTMLRPPRATGDKAEIQDIITQEAGGSYTLKYPQAGDNRSAIIMRNENKENEFALALYSTEKDTKINASVIVYREQSWKCIGTFDNICSGIDRVMFKDIDGDKNEEIIIGWTSYNSPQKMLTAYSMTTDGIDEMKIDETYDEIVVSDIVDDQNDDIVLLSLSTQDSPSMATLLQYSEQEKRPISKYSLELDSDVTAFTNITVGDLAVNTSDENGIKITASSAKTESSKQESAKSESSVESSKKESAKSESSVESSKKESAKPESSAESSKKESAKPESSAESSKQESSESKKPVSDVNTKNSANNNNSAKLTDLKQNGIVIDCERLDGTLCTQIIYYDKVNNKLINPLTVKNSSGGYSNITIRSDAVYSTDINGDSVIDIPVVSQMMADVKENGANVCTLTSWENYDAINRKMKLVINTVMNVKDGYYIAVPDRWNGNITARSDAETREMTFYLWNTKTSSPGDKLLTIYRFTEQQWNDVDKEGMLCLQNTSKDSKAIYAARIFKTNANDELNVSEDEVKEAFVIL